MNPCPCGNILSSQKACRCSDPEIKRYKNRLSDPFLDRIDLTVTMQESQAYDKSTISSKQMQEQVFKAFSFAQERKQRESNGSLSDRDIERYCELNKEGEIFLYRQLPALPSPQEPSTRSKKSPVRLPTLSKGRRLKKEIFWKL